MKIMLVSDYSSYAGDGTLAWFCERALRKLGHSVTRFDYRKGLFESPSLNRTVIGIPKMYRVLVSLMNRQLERKVEETKPHILFVIKGETISGKTLEKIRSKFKAVTVNWWPDDPHLFHLSHKLAPYYDYFFTHDSYTAQKYAHFGQKNAKYLPFACDPDIHKRYLLELSERETYTSDICFVGTCYPKREEIFESLTSFNISIWGKGWEKSKKHSPVRKFLKGKAIYATELAKAYSNSKIVLNFHQPYQGISYGTNFRTFEATGCGALLISEIKEDIRNLFKIGEEVICFNKTNELPHLLRYYLDKPLDRERIAKKGQERCHSEHTFVNRMNTMLSTIGTA